MSGTFEFTEAYQIIGIGDTATIDGRKAKVLSIERHHEQVFEANAGDEIGMRLAFVRAKNITAAKGDAIEFLSGRSKRAQPTSTRQPRAGSERGAPEPEGFFSVFRRRRT